jgi:hypothetical protein
MFQVYIYDKVEKYKAAFKRAKNKKEEELEKSIVYQKLLCLNKTNFFINH